MFGPERAVQNSPPRGPRRRVEVTPPLGQVLTPGDDIWESKLFVFFIPLDLVATLLICELVPTHFETDKLALTRVTATPYTA